MHPNAHNRRRTDRGYTPQRRPRLHSLRVVLGLAPAGELVPGLSHWRRTAEREAIKGEK